MGRNGKIWEGTKVKKGLMSSKDGAHQSKEGRVGGELLKGEFGSAWE